MLEGEVAPGAAVAASVGAAVASALELSVAVGMFVGALLFDDPHPHIVISIAAPAIIAAAFMDFLKMVFIIDISRLLLDFICKLNLAGIENITV